MKNLIAAVLLVFSISTRAALIDRGGGFIYDDVLDITWLQDANYAQTSGYDADGRMTWYDAMDFADGVSIYDSVRDVTWNDWRLPTTLHPDPTCRYQPSEGDGCEGSEMGHLNNVYGINATCDYDEPPNCDWGPFINGRHNDEYWSSTEYAPDTDRAWSFDFYTPEQYLGWKSYDNLALLVRDGDVAANVVPIPAAVWLFGSGLIGLGWFRRKPA